MKIASDTSDVSFDGKLTMEIVLSLAPSEQSRLRRLPVRRSLFAATVVLGCLGVASLAQAVEKVTPPLIREAKAQVGDQILHHGIYRQQPAIHLSEEIRFGERDQYALTPGYYIRTGQGLDSEAYAPASEPEWRSR